MVRSALASLTKPFFASVVATTTTEPLVAFTFDDGPDPDGTPVVLDLLARHRARATFFVLGERVDAHPALVRRAGAEGHEIALHAGSHATLPDLSAIEQARNLLAGRRAVTMATGQAPRHFRAPYGLQTRTTVSIARLLRMRPVMWSSYAAEWGEQPVAACIHQAAEHLGPGAIVLLHDGAAGRSGRARRPTGEVAEILDGLLAITEARGLTSVPVGELLRRGQPERRWWFRSWRV
jgi:peptidoglycan/xylan/chitin deacetylase (PgdA/CDA1 family)